MSDSCTLADGTDPAAGESPPGALRVEAVRNATPDIKVLELAAASGGDLPSYAPGAHLEIVLRDGLIRHYSLCGLFHNPRRYTIAVRLDACGRGGSSFVHRHAHAGRLFERWSLRNSFAFDETASAYRFVAGGVGITPLLPMMARARALGRPFTLDYCTRTRADTLFADEVVGLTRGTVRFHHSRDASPSRFDACSIGARAGGEQLYCCGPTALMNAVGEATRDWQDSAVRFEYFSAGVPPVRDRDGAFEIELAKSGAVYEVPVGKTILQVLRENRLALDSACEAGACGTCRQRYLAGAPDHRDLYLTDDERREYVMVCVSRALSPRLVLDL